MPRTLIRPIQDPVEGVGHWEEDIGFVGGKVVPTTKWVAHCEWHPHWLKRGCERCAEEATWMPKEAR